MGKNWLVQYGFSYFILVIATMLLSFQIANECDATALKKELKVLLKPDFKYDSSKTNRFTYKNKIQTKEIEIPLFMGEKYRFLFNTAGLPKTIKVEIYSKKIGHKKRKLLYNLEQEEGKHIYSYEPEKSRKMYLNYTISESSEVDMKGCIAFVLGYRIGKKK